MNEEIKKWKLTVSGYTLKTKLEQNSLYFGRMEQLKLVKWIPESMSEDCGFNDFWVIIEYLENE